MVTITTGDMVGTATEGVTVITITIDFKCLGYTGAAYGRPLRYLGLMVLETELGHTNAVLLPLSS